MAVSAHGTLLKMGDGATPEVFTTIGEVRDITGPGSTLSTFTVNSHDSVHEQVVPGIVSQGEVTFNINYTGAVTQKALETAISSRTLTNFELVIPLSAPETRAFAGYVTNFSLGLPVEGAVDASITITRSGAQTIT